MVLIVEGTRGGKLLTGKLLDGCADRVAGGSRRVVDGIEFIAYCQLRCKSCGVGQRRDQAPIPWYLGPHAANGSRTVEHQRGGRVQKLMGQGYPRGEQKGQMRQQNA